MSPSRNPWQRADTLTLAALLAVSSLWIALKVRWSWVPMEDAAMLLRYAQNFAAGHGIRWSLNQPPVDGATDFLYMLLTGALSRIVHIDVVAASRWVNIVAQTLSVALVYIGGRRVGGDRWMSAAAALYLIAGPFIGLTNACFGAPLFAFFLLACWIFALRYALESASWPNALAMATFALLAGLTRPEGVLIAALILIATLYLNLSSRPDPERAQRTEGGVERLAGSSALPLILAHLFLFGLLGGAYFLWRWHYFGYPLPNPFYIKGNGHLYLGSVEHATINLITLLLPALPLLPLGWLNASTRRLTNALLLVLVPFTLMWVLLSNQNNHLFRFQYAIVPLVLMTLPVLMPGEEARPPRPLALRAAFTLAILAAMLYVSRITTYTQTAWGMRDFALRLQPFATRGYTMAVTEAGALPLYSQWNTLDALGLNDAYVAHHHQQIDTAYLDRTAPELIMAHIDRSVPEEYLPNAFDHAPAAAGPAYNAEFLNFYAATHGYTLAAAWGADQCNLHLYWLRPNVPDSAAILSVIRDHPYIFLDDAFLSHDYRDDMASIQPCAAPEGPSNSE